ncbi:MAG: cob(I)yrinic acid a,c-diamide adenosyltransferase [Pseudomonadales bacterium]
MAGKRISKVTTRTGDHGKTKLATGRTVGKHSQIIRTVGVVDELNSYIGVALAKLAEMGSETLGSETIVSDPQILIDLTAALKAVQQALFDIGAVLAMEGAFGAPASDQLEAVTERFNEALPPLTEFVLPGGNEAAAALHVCRTVCRRAELEFWTLIEQTPEAAEAMHDSARYLNRLSDLCFVAARAVNAHHEEQWHGPVRD